LNDFVLQEIAALAIKIVRIVFAGSNGYPATGKRSGGTVDSLYNLPDILTIGRR